MRRFAVSKRSIGPGALVLMLVVALAAIAIGWALWSKVLVINSAVQTGRVHASIERAFTDDDDFVDDDTKDSGDTGQCLDVGKVDDAGSFLGVDLNKDEIDGLTSCDPAASGRDPKPRHDKDVARCDALVDPNNSNVAHIRKRNVYPSYFCTAWFDIHNDGTIPVKVAQVALVGMQEVTPGQIKPAPGGLAPLVPSLVYDVDLNGDTLPDINLHITDIELCQQIDPSTTVQMDVDQHVKQTAPQGTTLAYRLRIDLHQWNEPCPPPPPPPPPPPFLADFGDAPSPGIPELADFCSGPPANYPSLLADGGPFHTDFTDVWLGPHPNSETAEPDAIVPNCDDAFGAPFDLDDGCIAQFIGGPVSGWVCIPGDAGAVFGPFPGTEDVSCELAVWVFTVSVGAAAPAVPRFANVVVDDRCPGPDGFYGDVAVEHVLINAPVAAPPGGSEVKVTGLFFSEVFCDDFITPAPPAPPLTNCSNGADDDTDGRADEWGILAEWGRFEVSRSLMPVPWDGSGPAGGLTYGETEDWEKIGDPDKAQRPPPTIQDPRIAQVLEALGVCLDSRVCSAALKACAANPACAALLQRCATDPNCLANLATCAQDPNCAPLLATCVANSLCAQVLLACPELADACQAALAACNASAQCRAALEACLANPTCRLFVAGNANNNLPAPGSRRR